ncbi:type II toxin-antitoxin system VapC family toxin [Methylobacterium trifolii]|uniref:Ribonuclease VapC n=1 Tax=Methylobacterium trifolii TaxID=1003092 RepID=A0ABQ4TWS0_9HYPH|nr:type II toxin-antitoxin system VapC family toxin [Methylobacterium trifolii]GJE59501.1 Ribonuclease VapC42 [Methylobacterium trifolii]
MFIAASALVAILAGEPAHADLTGRVEEAVEPVTSALAVFEAVLAIRRKKNIPVERAENEVQSFLAEAGVTIVPIADDDGRAALLAFAQYGKGQGHPAQLNMGDCFAYACARTRNLPLLFVGNDFSRTDIRPALP